jgi:hypothetical protein
MPLEVSETVFLAARKQAADVSNPFAVERYGGIRSRDDEESVTYMLSGYCLSYCHMHLFSNRSSA